MSDLSSDYQIDVTGVVGRAYRGVIDNRAVLAELAWLPWLIIVGTSALAYIIGGGGAVGRVLAALVDGIGFLLFATTFLVRWHRFVLLGERDAASLFPAGWGDFLIAAVKLGVGFVVAFVVIGLLAALPPHILTLPIAVAASFAVAFVAVRIALVFPAAALARPLSFRAAWDLAAGNYWRLFGALLLCYVPFAIVASFIATRSAGAGFVLWLVFEALRLAVTFIGLAVAAAALSEAYSGLTRGR